MALTLSNYAKTLAPDLLLQAKKNAVRECDETKKGHFVAYVDDGNDSFDVSLTVKTNGEIIQHTCECKNTGNLCRHKAALIIHIAQGGKPKEVVKVKKKESKVDLLLNDIDPHRLKDWVKVLIDKNKDIELSFVHYFSAKEQLTPAEVTKIVNNAVKAVISNKKTIDQTQLKKLVELWSEMLAPVAEYYRANVTDERSFLNFHTMLEACGEFQFKLDSGSKKIPKFIEETLKQSIEPISNLHVEEGWNKAIGYFINHVPDGKNRVRMHYLLHLKNIVSTVSEERGFKIIDLLARQFEKIDPETLMNGTDYVKFIFEIVVEHHFFPKYSFLCKPIRFDNEYNQKLIRLLIDNNNLDLAKKYCNEQIKYNFQEEYNILYFKFLKEILLIQKDEAALERVLTVLFPFTFDFDDYLFISKRLPEEERKKWRTKMLTKARHMASNRKKEPVEFYFKLADHEKSYRKMIDYIDSYTPYSFILQYFEKMLQADKAKLLEAIMHKTDNYGWGMQREDNDATSFPELFKLLEKHYTANLLKMAIINKEKNRWYSSSGSLLAYIKKQLSF